VIPEWRIQMPWLGERVCTDGIVRYDRAAGWWERHPVTGVQPRPPGAGVEATTA
jgi:hypothetical protein